jgi:hypothetical protein
MKLFIMQVSPTICHPIPLRSNYSSQHSVYISPLMSEIKFHAIQNNRQNYGSVYFNSYDFRQEKKRQKDCGLNESKHYPNSIFS